MMKMWRCVVSRGMSSIKSSNLFGRKFRYYQQLNIIPTRMVQSAISNQTAPWQLILKCSFSGIVRVNSSTHLKISVVAHSVPTEMFYNTKHCAVKNLVRQNHLLTKQTLTMDGINHGSKSIDNWCEKLLRFSSGNIFNQNCHQFCFLSTHN
jgi:hypothetical protein